MTGSLGRVTGRESGRVGGVGTVQENEGFGSHPAVTTKPSFSLHDSRVTRLKGGCAPKRATGGISASNCTIQLAPLGILDNYKRYLSVLRGI